MLSVVLVQHIELVGMALGTAIPVAILEPLYLRTAVQELGVSWRDFLGTAILRAFGPALAAALPIAALMLVWDVHGLGELAAAGALYALLFGAAFVAVGLGPDERSRLRRVFRRSGTREPGVAPLVVESPQRDTAVASDKFE